MRLIATLSHVVCWLHGRSVQNGWTNQDATWGMTLCWFKDHASDEVKIGQIHSRPWGMTSWRCSLLPNYFGYLFLLSHTWMVWLVSSNGSLDRGKSSPTAVSAQLTCVLTKDTETILYATSAAIGCISRTVWRWCRLKNQHNCSQELAKQTAYNSVCRLFAIILIYYEDKMLYY